MSQSAMVAALQEWAETQKAALDSLVANLTTSLNGQTETAEEVEEAPAAKTTTRRRATKAAPKAAEPVEDVEDEDDEADVEAEGTDEDEIDAARRAELEAMRLPALRALALKREFKEPGVQAASKEDLIEAIIEDERSERLADGEGEEAEDESDDETVTFTREDLEAKGIRELRALAMEQGHSKADLTGLKVADVIDLILGEGDAAAEEEDEAETEEEDDEEGYYTREDFDAMSLAELKAVAREYDMKIPAGIKKPALIDALLGDDEEE
jgi:hypothetical protein